VTNGTAASRWSDAYDFVTPNIAPPIPEGNAPENQGTVYTPQPILTVNNVVDPDGTPVAYHYQLSRLSGFSSIIAQSGHVSEGSNGKTSWQVNRVLDDGLTYFWRARAFDGISYSGWMTVRSFTVSVADSNIFAMGDINVNGVANEVADAVMFSNFFVSGLDAFGGHADASIAASDVNLDGTVLSIADLVHQVRLIVGETGANPKPITPGLAVSVRFDVNQSCAFVGIDSPIDIGGAYFVLRYSGYQIGIPYLSADASEMSLKYAVTENKIKLLVYSMKRGIKIPEGISEILTVPLHGNGAIRLTQSELSDYHGNLIGLKTSGGKQAPDLFTMHQNHPNPFNATTAIRYELPEAGHVKLEIFNILGERTATLIDGLRPAGMHIAEWDGSDMHGIPAASGIYIYRMTVDGRHMQKKMILMK
jgi:hypothetical protein